MTKAVVIEESGDMSVIEYPEKGIGDLIKKMFEGKYVDHVLFPAIEETKDSLTLFCYDTFTKNMKLNPKATFVTAILKGETTNLKGRVLIVNEYCSKYKDITPDQLNEIVRIHLNKIINEKLKL